MFIGYAPHWVCSSTGMLFRELAPQAAHRLTSVSLVAFDSIDSMQQTRLVYASK